jgi:uncharacterized membrane protein
VIEQFLSENHAETQIVLRPRCAMTKTQFIGLFALLASATWGVAIMSYVQGNVFAPAFALLDCAVVAAALRWVWRKSNRCETIAFDAEHCTVWCSEREELAFDAHPYWVRMRLMGGDEPQVVLASKGKSCEVGSFLAPDERRDLADRMKVLLAQAHAAL